MKKLRQDFSRQECGKILISYKSQICEVYESAIQDFVEYLDFNQKRPYAHIHQTVCKTTMVWNYAISHAQRVFQGLPNVNVGFFNNNFGVIINQIIFLRFKKVDQYLNPHNYPTQQQIILSNGGQIEGFPISPMILVAGYIPDPTFSSVNGIYIVNKKGQNTVWSINLKNDDYQTGDIFEPEIPIDLDGEPLIRIKKGKTKHGKKTG